jgi:ribosomal protein S18 acetylase RimI-like enzyme
MTASPVIRLALPADVARLLAMMRIFYAGERLPFDEARAHRMLDELLDPNAYGFLYVIEARTEIAGYVLVTWGYSAEHGGPYWLVDELYVEAAHRGRGLGRATLDLVARLARERGASVIKLEVSQHNPEAAKLYLRAGFTDEKRRVLVQRPPAS